MSSTLLVVDSAPTVKDLNGNAGVYLWRLAGTPKKTGIVRHYYSVRYPSDRQLAPPGNVIDRRSAGGLIFPAVGAMLPALSPRRARIRHEPHQPGCKEE